MDGRNAVHGGDWSRRIRNRCRKFGVYYADDGRAASHCKSNIRHGHSAHRYTPRLLCLYVLMYSMVAFAHAIVLGATIIAKEERDRTAEFLYTMPYSRKTIISGKIIAAVINVLCMTIFTFLCIILTLVSQMNGESIMPEILTTMIGMFFAQMLCLAIGLFFSSLFNYHRTAMSMAILFFALSFVLAIVIEFVGNIEFLNFLTPFRYFFAPYVVTNGISSVYLLLSLFFAGVFIFLTYKLYEKRDIHC